MNLLSSILAFVVLGFLLRPRWCRRRAFVEVNPRYQDLLKLQGFDNAADYLDLQAVIVSGHPGRNVARMTVPNGPGTLDLFLKREERVSWIVRLWNACAGFGFVSLSIREARLLQVLPRAGINAPEWVAAGEDGCGRAFLLVRAVTGAVELREFLGRPENAETAEQLARTLGAAVARVHDAGFDHPDLYAKHVFVDRVSSEIIFLDWQRSRRRRRVSREERARDLAALNATVPTTLAGRRERLAFLTAYAEFWGWTREESHRLARAVLTHTERLLSRRHVREKLQSPIPGQQYLPLDGGTLCVTPAFQELFPDGRPAWLSLTAPLPRATDLAGPIPIRLRDGRRGLLIRRQQRSVLRSLWNLVRRRPGASPEQRQASLLLRLERHGVPSPRVLALGHRPYRFGGVDSLLLTEVPAGAERLPDWLARERDTATRRNGLRELGVVLRRLHDACCYLPDHDFPLAVRESADRSITPVLLATEPLLATRSPNPALASRNLSAFHRELRDHEGQNADYRWLMEGYTAIDEQVVTPAEWDLRSAQPRRKARTQAGRAEMDSGGAVLTSLEERPSMSLADVAEPKAETPSLPGSLWQRLLHGTRRLRQRADWPVFAGADWAGRIMDVDITDRFHAKQGRSTCRWVLHAPGQEDGEKRLAVYLKRHYRLPWWRGLLAALWPSGNWSPAFAEYEHLEWARGLGVPVPEVVAVAEYIGPRGRFRSVLAVEELTGMLPLHEAIPLAAARLDPETFRRWKRGLVVEMARLTRLLHDYRYFHKDLYLCHFFIDRDDTERVPEWRGRVFLIDLHRLAHHPWTWRLWQMKDLAQLLYSTDVPGVDARDRLLFWREYLGPEARGGRSWLRRFVLFKWRRYRRHNARRKAAAPDPA